MKKTFITLFAACCLLGIAHQESARGAVDARTGASELTTEDIHYTVAKNYFLKNNLDSLPPVKITSATDFDRFFGMATSMGKDGKPTEIDFSRQYVIAVALPETDTVTTLKPRSLVKSANGNLTFTCTVKQGEKLSYTSAPLLLVIASRKHDGNVTVNYIRK